MNIHQVARVCHETNRAYCETLGDFSQKPWDLAEEWQRDSARKGVEFTIANPHASPASQHEAWMRDKIGDGWKFGPVKDASKKEHPCIVPYHDLPIEQRLKDHLFQMIVAAFVGADNAK